MKKSYLKCDAENCDHIEYHDSITSVHVGKRCPKCKSVLLTLNDYEDHCQLKEIIDNIDFNKLEDLAITLRENWNQPVKINIGNINGKVKISGS